VALPDNSAGAALVGVTCAGCGATLSPSLLACPSCRRLRHGERLKQLAADAEHAVQHGALSDALQAWRDARDLLPVGSRQREVVDEKITALSQTVTKQGARSTPRPRSLWGWVVVVVALVLGKAKLLLMGLTKAGTLLSMLVAFGVYWTAWGWKFASGFVLSIFVHEMGHVAALRHYGVRATAPMFLPGIGAVVRFRQDMEPAAEARVGLAGPLWGCGTALVAFAVAWSTGSRLWAAIAHTGAWVNLFNLLPIVPLDGGRGFRALGRMQRFVVAAVILGAWYLTAEGLLLLLLVVALLRAFESNSAADDPRAFVLFVALILGLSLLSYAAAPLAAVAAR
jgi:Zn-dependent protease